MITWPIEQWWENLGALCTPEKDSNAYPINLQTGSFVCYISLVCCFFFLHFPTQGHEGTEATSALTGRRLEAPGHLGSSPSQDKHTSTHTIDGQICSDKYTKIVT